MILLGLGANLPSDFGSPEETIKRCIGDLPSYGITVLKASSVWESAPVPISDQPWYKNAVCLIETEHTPQDLLNIIQNIEHDFGRIRSIRNAARVIDLDLLAYNDIISDNKLLELPHPRMHERAFVLLPLQEIASDWTHPVTRKTLSALIKNLPEDQKIRKVTA